MKLYVLLSLLVFAISVSAGTYYTRDEDREIDDYQTWWNFGFFPFWYLVKPTCERPLHGIPNGYFYDMWTYAYYPGEKMEVGCEIGFKMDGNSVNTCGVRGWLREFPVCKPILPTEISCPKIPRASTRIASSYRPKYKKGQEIKFRCRSKHLLKGSKTLTCTENGWDRPAPRCIRHTCATRNCGENATCMLNKNKLPICVCNPGFTKSFIGRCIPKTCPPNMHYGNCGPVCQPSCEERNPSCPRICTEGCFCDLGYVLENKTCIPATECKCKYKSRIMETNDTFINDKCDVKCRCQDGEFVDCSEHTCGDNEQCVNTGGDSYKCEANEEVAPPAEGSGGTDTSEVTSAATTTIPETTTSPTETAPEATPPEDTSNPPASSRNQNIGERQHIVKEAKPVKPAPEDDACVAKMGDGTCICKIGFASLDEGKTCSAICEPVKTGTNVIANPSTGPYAVGTTVVYLCKGESTTGGVSSTCQESRIWSADPPTC